MTKYFILSVFSLVLTSGFLQAESNTQTKNFSFAVATDIHVFAPSLHDEGSGFIKYADSGAGVDINHGTALFNSLIRDIEIQKPSLLILTGDLTSNGELASHECIAQGLAKLKAQGIRCFVIPGNHDISNPFARRYTGSQSLPTKTLDASGFAALYKDYGYKQAISRDSNSLSYMAEAEPGLWILMLDTCKYADNLRLGRPETGGRLLPGTRNWIADCAHKAKSAGVRLIAAQHHSLVDHNPFLTQGFTIDDAPDIARLYTENGITLVLTGHIHAQDIGLTNTPSGKIIDIATNALSVFPNHWGLLQWDQQKKTIDYHSRSVDVQGWALSVNSTNTDLKNYKAWSENFLRLQSLDLWSGPGSEILATLNVRFFSGLEKDNKELITTSEYKDLESTPGFLGEYVKSIKNDTDDLDDNEQIGM